MGDKTRSLLPIAARCISTATCCSSCSSCGSCNDEIPVCHELRLLVTERRERERDSEGASKRGR